MFDGKIIDGRNRHRACLELGIEPSFTIWDGEPEDLVSFVVSTNLHRRHLSESQRSLVGSRLAKLSHGQRKQDPEDTDAPIGASRVSQSEAADMVKVGRMSIQRARVVDEQGIPELVQAVEHRPIASHET